MSVNSPAQLPEEAMQPQLPKGVKAMSRLHRTEHLWHAATSAQHLAPWSTVSHGQIMKGNCQECARTDSCYGSQSLPARMC